MTESTHSYFIQAAHGQFFSGNLPHRYWSTTLFDHCTWK